MTSTATTTTTDWQARAEAKRAAREALLPADTLLPPGAVSDQTTDVTAIPRTSGLLSAHELEITESETPAILAKLASGEWTSEAVTRAFCRRASIAHQLVGSALEYADGTRPTASRRSSSTRGSRAPRPSTRSSSAQASHVGRYSEPAVGDARADPPAGSPCPSRSRSAWRASSAASASSASSGAWRRSTRRWSRFSSRRG